MLGGLDDDFVATPDWLFLEQRRTLSCWLVLLLIKPLPGGDRWEFVRYDANRPIIFGQVSTRCRDHRCTRFLTADDQNTGIVAIVACELGCEPFGSELIACDLFGRVLSDELLQSADRPIQTGAGVVTSSAPRQNGQDETSRSSDFFATSLKACSAAYLTTGSKNRHAVL